MNRKTAEIVMRCPNCSPRGLRETISVHAAGEGVAVMECACKSITLPRDVSASLDVDVRVGLLAGIGSVNVPVVGEATGGLAAVDGVDEVDAIAACGRGRGRRGWWPATAYIPGALALDVAWRRVASYNVEVSAGALGDCHAEGGGGGPDHLV